MNLYDEISRKIIGRVAVMPAEAEALSKYASLEGDYLEIGCLWGGTAILAALSKIENGVDGHIYTVDFMRGGFWVYGDPGADNEVPSYTKVVLNLKAFAVENRVSVIVSESSPLPLPKGVSPRVVMIDGDHRFEGCMTDWLNAKTLKPDYVMLHDYDEKHLGVMRAVDQITEHDSDYKLIEKINTLIVFEKDQ